MADLMDMGGKAALLTGAASGLGRAAALRFAKAKANLFLIDINADGLAETCALAGEAGARVESLLVDLADPAQCRAAVDAAVARFGRLDALCNIAGYCTFAHAHEMELERFDRVLAINLRAPFLLSQAAIPHLISAEGAIVNIASCAAFIGESYLAAYSASKAGLVSMTKSLAMEYVKQPIRINAIAPGGMRTGMSGSSMGIPEDADMDMIKRFSGFRGTVELEDVADMILRLASPAGRSYHGACIAIDRGILAG